MPLAHSLTFQWPAMLWLLAAVPVLMAIYIRLLARRKRAALRFASLDTAWDKSRASGALRRHLPALLLLPGLCAMIAAVARPHAAIMLPSRVETVILAIDASGSMRATDIKPNRISAAQTAAKAFVSGQPGHVRVGVVAIAATAALVQSPTRSREDLVRAIDRLQPQRGSALGSGLVIALATLLPEARMDVEQLINGGASRRADPWRAADGEAFKPAPPGSNTAVAIVLLSDGQSNIGPDPVKMSEVAAERGVRIFTVGMGTPEGVVVSADGWSMRVRLDETALKKIAETTRGEYFGASNAADLNRIYRSLGARLTVEKQRSTEITAVFAAIGAALAMLSALLSLLWFNRIL